MNNTNNKNTLDNFLGKKPKTTKKVIKNNDGILEMVDITLVTKEGKLLLKD